MHLRKSAEVLKQPPQLMTNSSSPPDGMQANNGIVNMQLLQSPQHESDMNNGRAQDFQTSGSSPHLCNSSSNSPTYAQTISSASSGEGLSNACSREVILPIQSCLRNGCSNPAIDSLDWDTEYCSSECVVSHCKNVFATWVAHRQMAADSYSTVK